MKIINRWRWRARRARGRVKIALPTRELWIHHTADNGPSEDTRSSEAAYMRSIQAFHMDGPEQMRDIAYSWVVMPSGRVYKGRGWGIEGGHTRDRNHISHAICFAGNFSTRKPTREAIEAATALIRHGFRHGALTRRVRIDGHRKAPGSSTACPGAKLMKLIPTLRKWKP